MVQGSGLFRACGCVCLGFRFTVGHRFYGVRGRGLRNSGLGFEVLALM